MKKIIVLGLGYVFRKYEKEIYANYDVIGVTSNYTEESANFKNYIPLTHVHNYDYECVLICSAAEGELVDQLISMGIEKEKILIASIVFEKKGGFHSQYNEDAVVLLLLKLMGMDCHDVTYLELGTNHPIVINNTYSLYLRGASGILVEPNKGLKNLIELIRPRDILVNKAVSLDGKPVNFYQLDASSLSTTSYEKISEEYREGGKGFGIKEIYSVETVTMNDLIRMMEKTPDVLSIDIEGSDYDILCQIDYKAFRSKIMIVEIKAMGAKEQQGRKIEDLLYGNEYFLFCRNGVNAIFVDGRYREMVRDYQEFGVCMMRAAR